MADANAIFERVMKKSFRPEQGADGMQWMFLGINTKLVSPENELQVRATIMAACIIAEAIRQED